MVTLPPLITENKSLCICVTINRNTFYFGNQKLPIDTMVAVSLTCAGVPPTILPTVVFCPHLQEASNDTPDTEEITNATPTLARITWNLIVATVRTMVLQTLTITHNTHYTYISTDKVANLLLLFPLGKSNYWAAFDGPMGHSCSLWRLSATQKIFLRPLATQKLLNPDGKRILFSLQILN